MSPRQEALRLRTLGTLDLRDSDGTEITAVLSQPKRAAVLVYLAVARPGPFHRRDTLLTLFWPEFDESRARGALSQALSYLKRHLPVPTIHTRGVDEVGLIPGAVRTDVAEFEAALAEERWGAALEIYQGEFLRGFHVTASTDFEDWVFGQRDRLSRVAAESAWAQTREQIDRGNLVEAELAARRGIQLSGPEESVIADIMGGLAGAGGRTAALRLYERFVARVGEGLGLGVSHDLQALAETLKAAGGQGSNGAPGSDDGPGPPQAHLPASSTPTEATLPQATSPPPTSPSSPPPEPSASRSRLSKVLLRLAPFVMAGLVLLVAVALWYRFADPPPDLLGGTVVVLPLENQTGDPSVDPMGSWAGDHIANGLMDAGLGPVIPFRDVAGAIQPSSGGSGTDGPSRSWHEIFPAVLAVRGAYYALPPGDSIEFRLEVVDAGGGTLGIIDPVRGSLADPADALETLQVRVVGSVAGLMRPGHQLETTARGKQPPKLEAYWAFNEAWEIFSGSSFEEAIPLVERAMALDSTYFQPLLLLRSAYNNLGRYAAADSVCRRMEGKLYLADRYGRLMAELYCPRVRTPGRSELDINREMARLSSASFLLGLRLLDHNMPFEAAGEFEKFDTAMGNVFGNWEDRNAIFWARALHLTEDHGAELEVVRDVKPRFPENSRLAGREVVALIGLGRYDEASSLLDQELSLFAPGEDPVWLLSLVGKEFDAHGQRDRAREAWEGALTWYESRPVTERESRPMRLSLVWFLLYLDRVDEAEALLLPLVAESPEDAEAMGLLGVLKAKQGDSESARRISERFNDWDPPLWYGGGRYWQARIAAQLGDAEETVRRLGQAMEEGWDVEDKLHLDPFFKPLWGNRVFEEFRRSKG